MQEVHEAIRAKAIGDSILVDADHLNGPHVYQRGSDVNIDGLEAFCEVWCIVTDPESSGSPCVETYQIDTYASTPTRANAVAARIYELFNWDIRRAGSGTLPALVGRRLAECTTAEASSGDQLDLEAPRTLHHRPRQFRVATYSL